MEKENMFKKQALARHQQQEALKSELYKEADGGRVVDASTVKDNNDELRTTMTLSITIEDKKKLKLLALKKGKTVSGVIHEFVSELDV